ncbi:MAG TPA: sigma 54-interacting transcriptional regulator [Candidatus Binataceae bacterium]|nr:sigma 54-interacting transcriptional regulator [Candidatus Binataceae bacterium]
MTGSENTQRLKLLYKLGCAFATRIELDELIPFVITRCRDALEAEGASVLLLDRERNEFYFPYVSGQNPAVVEKLPHLRFPADLGIAGTVLKGGRPIRVDDAQRDDRLYHGVDRITGLVTRNLLAAPLTSHQGTIGVIEVVNCHQGAPIADDDLLFLEALSGSIAIAIENARLYEQVRESEAKLRTQVGVLRRDLARHGVFSEIVGTGPAMAEVFRLMEVAGASSISVLIQGETGTGKELVARAIHSASARSDCPMLAVNCAAVPETLLESELFGHRRGAFTGAIRDSPGLFRAASGGSVFLDEVADMPLPMQARLLRVLEQQEVVPVGDSFPRKVDVRVLSATNRDLKTEIARGAFREDLYYRLAVFPICLPPLRDRREDIPILASRFLSVAAEKHHKRLRGISPAAIEALMRFGWPGNVRELRNEMDRAVALAGEGEFVEARHLSTALTTAVSENGTSGARVESPAQPPRGIPGETKRDFRGETGSLRHVRATVEASYIGQVLREHSGNVSRTARALGLSRPALQKKLKEYHLR